MYTYLNGGVAEVRTRLCSVVAKTRTRGNGHEVKYDTFYSTSLLL